MELFETADLFGIERLKFMCEQAIINNIDCDNAAAILHASDQHSAMRLREQTMEFIINNFDGVSKSPGFEQLARTDVELVIEILKARKWFNKCLREENKGSISNLGKDHVHLS